MPPRGEAYVRPPLLAREPAPAWIARWRFRVLALLAAALLVLVCVLAFRQLTGANAQDPGLEAGGLPVEALSSSG